MIRSLVFISLFFCVAAVGSASGQDPCGGKDVLTAKSCAGDAMSPDEQALFDLVTKYRAVNGKPAVRLSQSLSMVANRHLIDLIQNVKFFTHGWSNCPYDIAVEKTWPCVSEAPQRLNSGYKGQGFETLFHTAKGNATPAFALDAWKSSKLHNGIILNLDTFKDVAWNEVGVAVNGPYAALWFGTPSTAATPMRGNGLGVSYEQAVAGLTKLLTIDITTTTVGDNTWRGFTTDKKTKLEILGSPKDITQASVGISMKLESDGKLTAKNLQIIVTLLGNLFPEWPNIDAWVTGTVAAISADRTVLKTKLVRKIAIEFRSDALDSLRLMIKPEAKSKYMEF